MKSNFFLIVTSLVLGFSFTSADADSDGKHLFILSGQSNMREPMIGTFSDTVKKALGEDKVIVISHARPSQPIMQWYRNWTPPEGVKKPDGGGKLYDELIAIVQRAIKGQKIKSTTLVWMQGEADAEAGWGSRYEESFFGVLDQFKADLGIKEINFVIGRINDFWRPGVRKIVDGDMMRALQVKMAESHEHGAWINTDDLNTGVNPWGTYEFDSGHFPNPGYRVMGQRFARKACQLVEPKLKLDEALFVEAFPDDARKMKTHLALGKPISGTQPDAAHSGGKSGLAVLVDGKLGAPIQSDPAWLAFPPTEMNIQFVIDLGQPTDVSSVAVNLLINQEASAHFPTKIDVSISANGTDYQHLLTGRSNSVSFDKLARQQNLAKDFKPQASLIFIDKQVKAMRYVKVEIVPDAASNSWVYLDEIMVNPVMK